MKRTHIWKPTWTFLMAGLVTGLLLSAGMGWMQSGHADEPKPAAPPIQPAQTPALSAAQQLSDAFAQVAEAVKPSVVTIFTEKEIKMDRRSFHMTPFEGFFGDQFREFFNDPRNSQPQKQTGLGSGVVVRENGIILTNNHVIDGADEIKVRFADGKELEATLKGRDPKTDLAVLQVEADNLVPISLGNSDQARVGEWVLAIGSPLSANLASTVTSGIISAKGRNGVGLTRYEDYIQTDAAINPGNSGGALVNLR
ncbi:MAG TPA: trypsin-like peptidase domain-containing protein, partial [Calditrichia bacterium]|nr:trypsin-like peptidase domain-containing protein [Calditrichia bacterium]